MVLTSSMVNCFLSLTLVVTLLLCSPLGFDASPVTSRHRRTDDGRTRITDRPNAGVTEATTRPVLGSQDYVDSWAEALDSGDDDDEGTEPSEDNEEQVTANEEQASANDASSDSSASSDHHQRRRELNDAMTSRILREQRRKHRTRQLQAISAIQALTNNLQTRAVCGWTYRNNHDMRRIPADLPEAVCDSLTVAGTRNRCEQVVYNVPVRKLEVATDGIVNWSARWLALKVGCTLATAGTVPYSVS